MPPSSSSQPGPLLLVCGDDEFAVQQRARQVYQLWCEAAGGMDHEIIDATAANSSEALRALDRLRLALQTLPFFGSAKVIWFQRCNFLGEERTATSAAVTDRLADVAQELKTFCWDQVRLLISAGRVDKRRIFYKTVEKAGTVELLHGLSAEDKDWVAQAERFVKDQLRAHRQTIEEEALAALIHAVGPNLRQLHNEVEKLSVYVGPRTPLTRADVAALVSPSKQAQAFGLAEALGERDLPQALRRLDEELWTLRLNRERNPIGLLYGLIAKVRVLLLLQEMVRLGWLKPGGDYTRFKTQLERLPAGSLPADKRFNPLAMHPFVLFKALPQIHRYTRDELVRAMERLLTCNRQLVLSGLEESVALQQALVEIIGRPTAPQP